MTALSLQRAKDYLSSIDVDAVLTGLDMPDADIRDILSDISSGVQCPVIVTGDTDDPDVKIACFDNGASDYVEMPAHFGELNARIRAHIRSQSHSHDSIMLDSRKPFHQWYIDNDRHQLFDTHGQSAALTHQEYIVFYTLYNQCGKVVSRYDLSQALKRKSYSPSGRSVDVTVSRLRKKISQDGKDSPCIQTVRGTGYIIDRRR